MTDKQRSKLLLLLACVKYKRLKLLKDLPHKVKIIISIADRSFTIKPTIKRNRSYDCWCCHKTKYQQKNNKTVQRNVKHQTDKQSDWLWAECRNVKVNA